GLPEGQGCYSLQHPDRSSGSASLRRSELETWSWKLEVERRNNPPLATSGFQLFGFCRRDRVRFPPLPPISPKGNREKENTVNPVIKKFQFGQSTVTLETGRIARQASGAVLVTVDNDVSVLATVVGAKTADPSKGFFPLSVHYQEKTYAAGKIPGGFFKREARPSEKETLTSRLIDRPIRPLFPEGFQNEVQVICTVVSTSKKTDPDIAAMIGTSAALAISGIPFNGPIGAARVAFHPETGYLLNPTYEQLKASSLDMVVAGTKDAVLMVESEAKELTEDQMLGAVLFAHDEF